LGKVNLPLFRPQERAFIISPDLESGRLSLIEGEVKPFPSFLVDFLWCISYIICRINELMEEEGAKFRNNAEEAQLISSYDLSQFFQSY
jgi:hypothetical protein